MVATGQLSSNGQKTEIVDLTDPSKSCLLEDTSFRWGSTGGLIGTTPIICGGSGGGVPGAYIYLNECILFGTSHVITMNSKRYYPTSVAINTNKIFILGGKNENGYLKSTEYVTLDGTEVGPTLPEGFFGSCAVKFHETGDIYLIGGGTTEGNHATATYTKNVWFSNPSNEYHANFSQGPSLMNARYLHACGTMSIGAKSIIVAAGGYAYMTKLSSVEILDPISSNQWVEGK